MARTSNKGWFTQFLLLVIIVILVGYGYYYISHQSAGTVKESTSKPTQTTTTNAPVTTTAQSDPATASWKTLADPQGFSFKYPSYVAMGPNSVGDLSNANPTALSYREFGFTPDPNADFTVFAVDAEADGAKNFILDLAQKFISYDPSTGTWYANSNDADKPTAADPKYKNLYKAGNELTPPVYGKTLGGATIYGPFSLGDDTRGTRWYLIPFPDKNLIVNFSIKFNDDALDQSTTAIKNLKTNFDKDFSHIIKSVMVTS